MTPSLRQRTQALVRGIVERDQVLIASHRGSAAGNIVQNTVRAFRAAQRQGADILELDVSVTSDGELFVYHDGAELTSFGIKENIQTLSSAQVAELRYFNAIGSRTDQQVEKLDDVLEELKGDVLINIDRGWNHWAKIVQVVDRHEMADQIILKGPSIDGVLHVLADVAPDYMFIPICRSIPDLSRALQHDLNFLGVEIVFASQDDDVVVQENLQRVLDMDLLLWANAIQLNEVNILADSFDDVTSLLENPDLGWGRLLEMGFRIIQTDFPAMLRGYLESRGHATPVTA